MTPEDAHVLRGVLSYWANLLCLTVGIPWAAYHFGKDRRWGMLLYVMVASFLTALGLYGQGVKRDW